MVRTSPIARHVLAIVPARGGSKGLTGKNLRPFLGEPLVSRAVRAALAVERVATVYCSTDDPAIADVAKNAGAWVPSLRPAEISGDSIPMSAVVRHVVATARTQRPELYFSAVLLVQPTCPLRTVHHLNRALDEFEERRQDGEKPAAVHVVASLPRIGRLWRGDSAADLGPFRLPKAAGMVVWRTGAAVVLDPERPGALSFEAGPVFGIHTADEMVSIDDAYDFAAATNLATRG